MLLPVVLLAGCSSPSNAERQERSSAGEVATDRAAIGGTEASLFFSGDGCLLRREGQADLPLAPAPPCRFLRVDGKVQQHAYPDRRIDAVILVVGTAADRAKKAHFGVPAGLDCGTVAQGLVVRGATVSAARRPLTGGLYCVDQGRDEKDFYTVAHER